jgi:hypothetical protein
VDSPLVEIRREMCKHRAGSSFAHSLIGLDDGRNLMQRREMRFVIFRSV